MAKEVMRSCKWMDRQHNGQRDNEKLYMDGQVLPFTASHYLFGHCVVCPSIYSLSLPLWPLCCLSIHLQLLITSLAIVLSVHPFTASHYLFGHCVVCPSIYSFSLPLWQLCCLSIHLQLLITSLAIVLSVYPFTASHYLFGHYRQHNGQRDNEKLYMDEQTTQWPEIMRSCKWMDRQHNGQRRNEKL
jgi:hypothetical protein